MKKYKLLTIILFLSFGLIACAQTRVDAALQMPTASNDLKVTLTSLAKLANLDSPTINIKALSVLAQTDFEKLVKNNTTQDELVSVQHLIPNTAATLNSGIVSVSYSKQYAAKVAVQYVESNKKIPQDFETKHLVRVGIVLNPMLLCIKAQDVQNAWQEKFKDTSFSKLSYGAGSLWPADSLHKNYEEQKRRGNGPIEIVVNIKSPLDSAHKSAFKFSHDYWACAQSVVLERRY